MRTRRLDESKLTPEEKRHSVALAVVALSTIFLSFVVLAVERIKLGALELGLTFILMISTGVLGFVYGYIGAMEDERTRGS